VTASRSLLDSGYGFDPDALNTRETEEVFIASEIKRIQEECWSILEQPQCNRIERILTLQMLCACKGLIVGNINEEWLSKKQIIELRRQQQKLVERVLRAKAVRRKQNRRTYLRRAIRKLEEQEINKSGNAIN
jgi:hypothetical protein